MGSDRPPGDFGGKLRAARERRGISLRQIANSTKISISALEALERNDISRLPGGIFSRAFVRSYAIEVGLDPETTIHDFLEQFPHETVTAGHAAADAIEDHEAIESDRTAATTVLRLVGISVIVAGVLVYFTMVGRHSGSHAPEPVAEAAQPMSPPAATSATSAAGPPPSPAVDAASAPSNPPAPQPAPPESAVKPAAADTSEHLTVAFTAVRPCWVSVTLDGRKAVARLFQTGEEQRFDVQREIVLTAGDATALTLTVNGAPVRAIGKPGEVATARINPSNYKDFTTPR